MSGFPEWAEPILTLLVYAPASPFVVILLLALGVGLRKKFNLMMRIAVVLLSAGAGYGYAAWSLAQATNPTLPTVIVNQEIRIGIWMMAVLLILILGFIELASAVHKRKRHPM